ncbi:MAG: AarF/UbiB family protein [Clostridiaceae bacterium]
MNDKDTLANETSNCFNIDLQNCTFLGQGRNGHVYLLPDGKVLKIFFEEIYCKHEYDILQSVNENKHFPKVYEYKENCMIREYIDGIPIKNYIETNGLNRNLIINIVNLIEDFRKSGFTKLDIRCAHIFIQNDESIRVIDPRCTYTKVIPYPYSILKCLDRLDVLEKFFSCLKEIDNELFQNWNYRYIYDKSNKIHYWE